MAISTRNIKSKAIIPELMKGIKIEQVIELLPGRYEGLALDTTGIKVDLPFLILLAPWMLKHLKYAYFEIAYDVTGTTAGAFEARLRNVTDATDIAVISISPGTRSRRKRSDDIAGKIVADKEIGVHFVVTTAAATGETGDFISAKLIMKLGIG